MDPFRRRIAALIKFFPAKMHGFTSKYIDKRRSQPFAPVDHLSLQQLSGQFRQRIKIWLVHRIFVYVLKINILIRFLLHLTGMFGDILLREHIQFVIDGKHLLHNTV